MKAGLPVTVENAIVKGPLDWRAEGQETKEREKKESEEEISWAMSAHGHDPTPIREATGG